MRVVEETHIHNSIVEVYEFLLDVNNYLSVLPEKTGDFHVVDSKTFVLQINKSVTLRPLSITSSTKDKQVIFTSEDHLDMKVTVDLIETDKKKSKAVLTLEVTNLPKLGVMFGERYAKRFLKDLTKKVKKIK